MKKIISLLLAFAIFFTACGTSVNSGLKTSASVAQSADTATSEPIAESTTSVQEESVSVDSVSDSVAEADDNIEIRAMADRNPDLSDEDLQRYLCDEIYLKAVESLDSDEYCIDNVQAVYYSKEYIEQLEYNSQENIYFGFTQAELDSQFAGKKYVFTFDDASKQTKVIEVESYEDHSTEEILKDVAIGSGVLLICVTVSVATAGVAPAISMIFAVGAQSGATAALSGAAIGGISAGLVKGYQTGSFSDAMSAAAKGAAEGFKWGAIMGALSGGASETWGLHKATANGLSMKDAAEIQKESKYPLDIIKQFKSKAEYEIYKDAGLRTQMVNGKLALVQDIDWDRTSTLPDGTEVTNKWLVEHNYSPVDENGLPYEIHHVNQDADGTLAILKQQQHRGKGISKILNQEGKTGVHNPESGVPDAEWARQKHAFWKDYLKQCMVMKG